MTNAEWTTLEAAGLTYGDTFTLVGTTKAKPWPRGRTVRIEAVSGTAFRLVEVSSGEVVEQATSLRRAKWWVA